jgi:serine/threonine protein kinase
LHFFVFWLVLSSLDCFSSYSTEENYSLSKSKDGVLGKGSFAKVYIGKRKRDDLPCAIKESDSSSKEVFDQEVAALKKLQNCSFVIDYLDSFSEDRKFYIVLELAETDLKKIIDYSWKKNHKFFPEDIESIFCQILCALCHFEELGIVHSDLKPANVLVMKDAYGVKVKVCDFGLVRNIGESRNGDDVGTLWYRSPEMALEVDIVTSKIDVWSLGCIVLEMYTLYPVFYGVKVSARENIDLSLAQFDFWSLKKDEYIIGICEINPRYEVIKDEIEYVDSPIHPYILTSLHSEGIDFMTSGLKSKKIDFNYLLYYMLQLDPDKRLAAKDLFNLLF